jgi:hypothetical protein
MSRRYFNEIRLGEPLKSDIRTIMHDVADRFDDPKLNNRLATAEDFGAV